jgi:hypothetical protein
VKLGSKSSLGQLHERVRELETEKRALETALRQERERTAVEQRRADVLQEVHRSVWRIAAQGKRPETA